MHAVMRQILTFALLLVLSGCFSGVTHDDPDVVIWGFDGFALVWLSVFLGTFIVGAGFGLGQGLDWVAWRLFPRNREQPSIVAACVFAAAGLVGTVYLSARMARNEVKFGPESFVQDHWFSPDIEVKYSDITRVRLAQLESGRHSAGEHVRVELQSPLEPNGDPWVDLSVHNLPNYRDALLVQFRERTDPSNVETP